MLLATFPEFPPLIIAELRRRTPVHDCAKRCKTFSVATSVSNARAARVYVSDVTLRQVFSIFAIAKGKAAPLGPRVLISVVAESR